MSKYPRLKFTVSQPKSQPRRRRGGRTQTSPQTSPSSTIPTNPLAAIDGDLAELKSAIQDATGQLRSTVRPLVGTDGRTVIDADMKKRGEVVEIVGNQKLMRDKVTGKTWIERLY